MSEHSASKDDNVAPLPEDWPGPDAENSLANSPPTDSAQAAASQPGSGQTQGTQDDEAAMSALAQASGQSLVTSSDSLQAAPEFLKAFEIGYARHHGILGVETDDGLRLALSRVESWPLLDVVGRVLKHRVRPLFATPECIDSAINSAYQERTGQAQQLLDSMSTDDILSELQRLDDREDLLDSAGRAPVVKLVNHVLFEAVKSRASDVHIQPYEDRVVVRQRIDGVLFDSFEVPKGIQEEVLSRIKVLGGMNIAEKRLPQDGRATVQVGDRLIDLRIASLPTSHNERIVIRLLDKSARMYTLGELGMGNATLDRFRNLINRDHGLMLVTGPTGSGKSTTLYAALQEINTIDQNVLTLEDPIEYQLEGVSQTQINEKKGMTFASGLRSVLRQDPDIIMLGEIRDQDTAVMAIQASLTGHMVFSTLHTNDAASAATRLLDLGIEPYLVASSLVGSLAQRLVRRLCDDCKRTLPADTETAASYPGLAGRPIGHAVGCERCRMTGFLGRLGLFELLVVDDACRAHIQERGNATQIRDEALQAGMVLLYRDGMAKVADGVTTVSEVVRVATGSSQALPDLD